MTHPEAKSWPEHLNIDQRRATINQTRNNATARIIKSIPSTGDLQMTPEMVQIVHDGIETISELPDDALITSHIYQVLIAAKDIVTQVAHRRELAELDRILTETGNVNTGVLRDLQNQQGTREQQVNALLDQTMKDILEKPDQYTNPRVRTIVEEVLQIRTHQHKS